MTHAVDSNKVTIDYFTNYNQIDHFSSVPNDVIISIFDLIINSESPNVLLTFGSVCQNWHVLIATDKHYDFFWRKLFNGLSSSQSHKIRGNLLLKEISNLQCQVPDSAPFFIKASHITRKYFLECHKQLTTFGLSVMTQNCRSTTISFKKKPHEISFTDNVLVANVSPFGIQRYSMETGKELRSIRNEDTNALNGALATFDGKIATGGYDGKIIIWNGSNPCQKLRIIDEHKNPINYLNATNGKLIAASDDFLTIHDSKTWECLYKGNEGYKRRFFVAAQGILVFATLNDATKPSIGVMHLTDQCPMQRTNSQNISDATLTEVVNQKIKEPVYHDVNSNLLNALYIRGMEISETKHLSIWLEHNRDNSPYQIMRFALEDPSEICISKIYGNPYRIASTKDYNIIFNSDSRPFKNMSNEKDYFDFYIELLKINAPPNTLPTTLKLNDQCFSNVVGLNKTFFFASKSHLYAVDTSTDEPVVRSRKMKNIETLAIVRGRLIVHSSESNQATILDPMKK